MSENNISPYRESVDRLHECAAHGDIQGILEALKVVSDVNATNDRGWTALMFAARNGHRDAVHSLIDNGCDATIINSLGQTAHDIAEFWLHDDVASDLSRSLSSSISADAASSQRHQMVNYFCDSPLNRMSQKRDDAAWMNDLLTAQTTVFLLFAELDLLAQRNATDSAAGAYPTYRAVRFTYKQVESYLDGEHRPTVVFLGVEESPNNDEPPCGWFAVDASPLSADEVSQLCPQAERISIHPRMLKMSRSEAAIIGHARSMLAWHDRYRFCPTCGSATEVKDAGYKRTCVKEDCRSNSGVHNTCYPRTDPTVIVAVLSMDKQKILLGRNSRFPGSMYSCLAGFMEPGESIEEACRREVFEESGVRVGHVEYHSCQPWPMPSSLMIGCIGHAESDLIKVDKTELDDARWFNAQDIRLMLTRQHPEGLFCPPSQAIAHHLIKHSLSIMSKL